MTKQLPIFATIRDAFVILFKRLPRYALAWVSPGLLAIILGFFSARYADQNPPLSLGFLALILSMMGLVWMFVSITQVTLHNKVPAKGLPYWTMRETWLVLRTIGWYILLLLTMLVFAAAMALLNMILPVFFSLTALIIVGLIGFCVTYFVALRLMLILPATASGDATSFAAIWEMSKGHVWRLLGLFVAVSLIMWVILSPLLFLAQNEIGNIQSTLPAGVPLEEISAQQFFAGSTFFKFFPFVGGIFMIPVTTYMVIIVALAYKALRKE